MIGINPMFFLNVLSDYLQLPSYLKLKWRKFSKKDSYTYENEEAFWFDALGPIFYERPRRNRRLVGGEIIRLKNLQLTDWVPRLPGLYWTKVSFEKRKEAKRLVERKLGNMEILYPHPKSNMVLGGLGSLRINKRKNLKLLCCTSSGNCDAGIPVILKGDLYDEIQKDIKRGMQIDIEGYYSIIPDPLYLFFRRSSHLPKYCIFVESRLSMKKKENSKVLKLSANAWTLYQTTTDEFLYAYAPFNPMNENKLIESVEFIRGYIFNHGGQRIVTDFDEEVPRFSALVPLKDVMGEAIDQDDLIALVAKFQLPLRYPF
ncbi:MAG: hypothetical protein J3T61_04595 [Candidatus Brocadiales bacterium]|nr:hypothetical protein [Candidatus Bathyanammoxibius sp.]